MVRETTTSLTGYSNRGRWTKFFIKWPDFNGNEHFATNFNTSPLPPVGDSIDIIYYLNDINYGIINKDEDLMGGLKSKGIKLFIIVILNIGFLIYY
jgi:tetrahydromethanopterin S-methyltransferase subunit F